MSPPSNFNVLTNLCINFNFSDKAQREEDKVGFEHRSEVDELHKDLQEKDGHMEQMIEDYEVQLQVGAWVDINYYCQTCLIRTSLQPQTNSVLTIQV